MLHSPGFRIALAVGLVAGLSFAPPAEAARKIRPAWSISQAYGLHLPVGQASLVADFSFPVGDGGASLRLSYDENGGLIGGGTISTSLDIYGVSGTSTLDVPSGEQRVHLEETSEPPRFLFDGVVAADGGDIAGTMTRKPGFGGLPDEETAPLTIRRLNGSKGTREFILTISTRMDAKGRIRGSYLGNQNSESTATLTVFGRHVFNGFEFDGLTLTGGRIRGKVKTDATGATAGLVTIDGPDWSAHLEGPIDEEGFHAVVEVHGGGFDLTGISMLLGVLPGPTGPPPPPPPPPKNLLSNAKATIVNGMVTITHTAVPKKFFRAKAGLKVEFPLSDGISVVHADPTTASLPIPRRVTVTVGQTTYGVAMSPADVTLDVKNLATLPGQVIRVLATGTVVAQGPKSKPVDVLIEAIVQ